MLRGREFYLVARTVCKSSSHDNDTWGHYFTSSWRMNSKQKCCGDTILFPQQNAKMCMPRNQKRNQVCADLKKYLLMPLLRLITSDQSQPGKQRSHFSELQTIACHPGQARENGCAFDWLKRYTSFRFIMCLLWLQSKNHSNTKICKHLNCRSERKLKRQGNNIGEKKLEREQQAPRGEFLPRQFQTALLVLAWTTLLKLSTCTSCQFGHNLACEQAHL